MRDPKEIPEGFLYGRKCKICRKADNKKKREFNYICKQCKLEKKEREKENRIKKMKKESLTFNRKYLKQTIGECFCCKSKKYLQLHHLDKKRNNNNQSNLMLLCKECHLVIHNEMREFDKLFKEDKKHNFFIYLKLKNCNNSFYKRFYPFRSL
jgi:5-methylcytosine-specific restriction endonuclease McrA